MALAEVPVDEKIDAVLDRLDPKYQSRTWKVTDNSDPSDVFEREYTQKPLGFKGKLDFFALLGGTLERAAREDSVSVGSIIQSASQVKNIQAAGDAVNAEDWIQLLGRLSTYAPDFIFDTYCLSLRVPYGERVWVKGVWENELSDDDGMEMLNIFIDQNVEALRDFFVVKLAGLIKTTQAKFGGAAPASSKPSKVTRRSTPKP